MKEQKMTTFSLFKKTFEKKNAPILVGRICYMNVLPIYYGIDRGMPLGEIEVIDGSPSALNRMLAVGGLDISPVSSFAYAHHQDGWMLLPDLSISCHGNVMSVLLASRYPMEGLKDRTIVLTDESASAAALLKLILAKRKITPNYKTERLRTSWPGGEQTDAVLVIGNTALNGEWGCRYPYVYDLGKMWEEMTGCPFVFAVWAVRRKFAANRPHTVSAVHELFRISKKMGLENMERIAEDAAEISGLDISYCRQYYKTLKYDLQEDKINGLKRFFEELHIAGFLSRKVELSFFENRPEQVIPFPSSKQRVRGTTG